MYIIQLRNGRTTYSSIPHTAALLIASLPVASVSWLAPSGLLYPVPDFARPTLADI